MATQPTNNLARRYFEEFRPRKTEAPQSWQRHNTENPQEVDMQQLELKTDQRNPQQPVRASLTTAFTDLRLGADRGGHTNVTAKQGGGNLSIDTTDGSRSNFVSFGNVESASLATDRSRAQATFYRNLDTLKLTNGSEQRLTQDDIERINSLRDKMQEQRLTAREQEELNSYTSNQVRVFGTNEKTEITANDSINWVFLGQNFGEQQIGQDGKPSNSPNVTIGNQRAVNDVFAQHVNELRNGSVDSQNTFGVHGNLYYWDEMSKNSTTQATVNGDMYWGSLTSEKSTINAELQNVEFLDVKGNGNTINLDLQAIESNDALGNSEEDAKYDYGLEVYGNDNTIDVNAQHLGKVQRVAGKDNEINLEATGNIEVLQTVERSRNNTITATSNSAVGKGGGDFNGTGDTITYTRSGVSTINMAGSKNEYTINTSINTLSDEDKESLRRYQENPDLINSELSDEAQQERFKALVEEVGDRDLSTLDRDFIFAGGTENKFNAIDTGNGDDVFVLRTKDSSGNTFAEPVNLGEGNDVVILEGRYDDWSAETTSNGVRYRHKNGQEVIVKDAAQAFIVDDVEVLMGKESNFANIDFSDSEVTKSYALRERRIFNRFEQERENRMNR